MVVFLLLLLPWTRRASRALSMHSARATLRAARRRTLKLRALASPSSTNKRVCWSTRATVHTQLDSVSSLFKDTTQHKEKRGECSPKKQSNDLSARIHVLPQHPRSPCPSGRRLLPPSASRRPDRALEALRGWDEAGYQLLLWPAGSTVACVFLLLHTALVCCVLSGSALCGQPLGLYTRASCLLVSQ